MKTFIVAAFAALSLASGAARNAAKTACENPMPIEAALNAETKPGETLTTTGGAPPSPEATASPQSPLKLPLVNPRVVVSKGKRQLALYAGGAVVRTYRIALGANPSDDKVRQGDRATPEGDFYICVKNARSNFYLSLGLSYPNAEDAERGLRDKLITRAERNAIVRAIQNKRRPPWNTALGGEIFIHGGGTDGDWTWGCVALSNADIKELFDALPLGTSVRIEH
ncbi:MAG: L,D-transpeptidase [Acidobacteria bacterium]|nr:L,D-transpeptidase [Acidobacteriota bacterium]